METGTPSEPIANFEIKFSSNNRTYPPIPLFVILWSPWKHIDDVDDRVRIWGIYGDEVESKRVYEELIKLKTSLNERGGFTWIRCENINHGPDDLERCVEFEMDGWDDLHEL